MLRLRYNLGASTPATAVKESAHSYCLNMHPKTKTLKGQSKTDTRYGFGDLLYEV
jgi:hypothetical protein